MREAAYIQGPFDRIIARATIHNNVRVADLVGPLYVDLTGAARITTYSKTVPVVDDAVHYPGMDIASTVIYGNAPREAVGVDDLPTHDQMLRWNERGFYVLVVNSEPAPLIYHWFDKERRFDGNWPDSYA